MYFVYNSKDIAVQCISKAMMPCTVFTPINALGVYKKNSILGWAFIGEGRLKERGVYLKK